MTENKGRTYVVIGGQLRLEVNGALAVPIEESMGVPRVGVYCFRVREVVATEGCRDCTALVCRRREEYGLGPRVLEKVEPVAENV